MTKGEYREVLKQLLDTVQALVHKARPIHEPPPHPQPPPVDHAPYIKLDMTMCCQRHDTAFERSAPDGDVRGAPGAASRAPRRLAAWARRGSPATDTRLGEEASPFGYQFCPRPPSTGGEVVRSPLSPSQHHSLSNGHDHQGRGQTGPAQTLLVKPTGAERPCCIRLKITCYSICTGSHGQARWSG
jgi:hypothetical protein